MLSSTQQIFSVAEDVGNVMLQVLNELMQTNKYVTKQFQLLTWQRSCWVMAVRWHPVSCFWYIITVCPQTASDPFGFGWGHPYHYFAKQWPDFQRVKKMLLELHWCLMWSGWVMNAIGMVLFWHCMIQDIIQQLLCNGMTDQWFDLMLCSTMLPTLGILSRNL